MKCSKNRKTDSRGPLEAGARSRSKTQQPSEPSWLVSQYLMGLLEWYHRRGTSICSTYLAQSSALDI